jgi:hypothetical protein
VLAAAVTVAAVAGIDTAVAAFACWPFCISIAPPIMHRPTPHSVTAPAIAFLLIVFSSISLRFLFDGRERLLPAKLECGLRRRRARGFKLPLWEAGSKPST